MLRMAVTLALLLGSVPAAGQTIEVAEGDWRTVPRAIVKGDRWIGIDAVERIEEIVGAGECPRAGTRNRVDISVPFLIRFTVDGAVERVVMQRIGCPEVENLLGNHVLRLAEAGEYAPTGENQTGWYRSEIGFSSKM